MSRAAARASTYCIVVVALAAGAGEVIPGQVFRSSRNETRTSEFREFNRPTPPGRAAHPLPGVAYQFANPS